MPRYEYAVDGWTEELTASSMDEAVKEGRELLKSGDWGEISQTVTACVRELDHGDVVRTEVITHLVVPPEPECDDAEGHQWEPYPNGVRGIGGSAIRIITRCAKCGLLRKEIFGDVNTTGCRNGIEYLHAEPDET